MRSRNLLLIAALLLVGGCSDEPPRPRRHFRVTVMRDDGPKIYEASRVSVWGAGVGSDAAYVRLDLLPGGSARFSTAYKWYAEPCQCEAGR